MDFKFIKRVFGSFFGAGQSDLSFLDFPEECAAALKKEFGGLGDVGRSGTWEILLKLPENHQDVVEFTNLENYDAAERVLKDIRAAAGLEEQIGNCRFYFNTQLLPVDEVQPLSSITIQRGRIPAQYKLVVSIEEEDGQLKEIESVTVEASKGQISVGRYTLKNPDCDIQLGRGTREKYPVRGDGRLIDVVSRKAFSLYSIGQKYWFCQVQKQGDHMYLQIGDEIIRPLSRMYRGEQITINDKIHIFGGLDDQGKPQNHIIIQVQPKD